jgi:hypothetical protein
MRYRVQAAADARAYSDFAITPVIDAEGEELEMFALNDSARAAVEKARHQAERPSAASSSDARGVGANWWGIVRSGKKKPAALLPTR